jgi:hypothetical protein
MIILKKFWIFYVLNILFIDSVIPNNRYFESVSLDDIDQNVNTEKKEEQKGRKRGHWSP